MIILLVVTIGIIIMSIYGYLSFNPEHRARGEGSTITWIFFGGLSIITGFASYNYYKDFRLQYIIQKQDSVK